MLDRPQVGFEKIDHRVVKLVKEPTDHRLDIVFGKKNMPDNETLTKISD